LDLDILHVGNLDILRAANLIGGFGVGSGYWYWDTDDLGQVFHEHGPTCLLEPMQALSIVVRTRCRILQLLGGRSLLLLSVLLVMLVVFKLLGQSSHTSQRGTLWGFLMIGAIALEMRGYRTGDRTCDRTCDRTGDGARNYACVPRVVCRVSRVRSGRRLDAGVAAVLFGGKESSEAVPALDRGGVVVIRRSHWLLCFEHGVNMSEGGGGERESRPV
jgi:hypothetical protein